MLRRKSCSTLGQYLNPIMLGMGTPWIQSARQHLSLDDLNGFLAITRNVHFLSLWHSQPQPLDTIDCTFLSPPLHALTSCFLWLSRVSESQVQVRQQEKKTLFYFAQYPAFVHACVSLCCWLVWLLLYCRSTSILYCMDVQGHHVIRIITLNLQIKQEVASLYHVYIVYKVFLLL